MAWVGSHGDVSRHVVCGSILESWRNIPCGTSSEASAAYLEGEIMCVCVRAMWNDSDPSRTDVKKWPLLKE